MNDGATTIPELPDEATRRNVTLQADRRTNGLLTRTGPALAFLTVLFFAAIFMMPLYWMVSTSLKTLPEVFLSPPTWWAAVPQWHNYPDALKIFPFWHDAWNTVQITVPVTIGTTISSACVAYSFARLRWPGRDVLFYLVLATLMIPNWVTLVPLYILYNNIGWINTYRPLIVPSFLGDAFSIFLLRQFFLRQPQEIMDAARVDGAAYLRTFAQIVVPLARPALAVVALFAFINSWTDFFNPLIYLSDPDSYTLQLGLFSFFGQHLVQWPGFMAATFVVLAPIAVLFLLAQRTFIEGITFTGLRG